MSRSLAQIMVLLVGSSAAAWAGSWSLGSHFGAGSVLSGPNEGSSGVWAMPSNVLTYQPALRVGFGNFGRSHELQADGGVLIIDQAGSTFSLIMGSVSYQHVFGGAKALGPLANAGFGFLREGGAARTSIATSYGFGLGIRRVVREGHGALRAEARFDYLTQEDEIGRPALKTIGLRIGFDLWL